MILQAEEPLDPPFAQLGYVPICGVDHSDTIVDDSIVFSEAVDFQRIPFTRRSTDTRLRRKDGVDTRGKLVRLQFCISGRGVVQNLYFYTGSSTVVPAVFWNSHVDAGVSSRLDPILKS